MTLDLMPSDEQILQTGHASLAVALVFMFMVCLRRPVWWCAWRVLVLAAWKEFCYDIISEQDSWWSSTVDFHWYCWGVLLALVIERTFRSKR